MSSIMKAVKKVWRPIEKLASKVTNVATFGLHDKWKETRHKILKSKAFKVVAIAATIYFGGAALMSLAGGGTASAGLGSAWAGAQGAGSAVAAGNFSGAASALGTGFTGGASAGATAGFSAGQAATQATIAAETAATAGTAVSSVATGEAAAGATEAATAAGATEAGTVAGTTEAATAGDVVGALGETVATDASSSAASEGLLSSAWNGLGEAGKAAIVTGGIQMAGSALQGSAEQEAAEEERKRLTYWGVDGEGNKSLDAGKIDFGLMNNANYQPYQPPATNNWQTSLDDLIDRQKQYAGSNT